MTSRSKNSDFESNQDQSLTHVTPVKGGTAPSKDDVIASANARSKMRHETGGDEFADVNVLPKSGGDTLDKSGVNDSGYLTKKGTPYGVNVHFNSLPPGSEISDQEMADIREEPFKTWTGGLGFPGDGGF